MTTVIVPFDPAWNYPLHRYIVWCLENLVVGEWQRGMNRYNSITFLNDEDATAFRLIFGL